MSETLWRCPSAEVRFRAYAGATRSLRGVPVLDAAVFHSLFFSVWAGLMRVAVAVVVVTMTELMW